MFHSTPPIIDVRFYCGFLSTSEVLCPGLVTPGWNWGLLTGTGRRGAGLLRTTVLEMAEAEVTGAEAGWGS